MAPKGAGKKKQGLFCNAKYSKTVFKNLSTSVMKRVERDIAKLVEHDEPTPEINKWIKAPPVKKPRQEENFDFNMVSEAPIRPLLKALQPRRNLNMGFDPHRGFKTANQFMGEQDTHVMARDDFIFNAPSPISGPSAPYKPPPQTLANQISRTPTFLKTTPEEMQMRRKKARNSEPEKLAFFPDDPPMEEIVDRICLAIPHLTLRNDESITYTDEDCSTYFSAAYSIVKEALLAQLNLREPSESTINRTMIEESEDVYQTLHDCTNFFNIDGEEGELLEEDSHLNDESPTRIDLSQLQIPDPLSIRNAFIDVDQSSSTQAAFANNIFHMFSQDFERNFNFTSPTSFDPDAPVIPDIFSQTQNSEKDSSSYHWEIPPAPLVFEENYSSTFKTPQFDF